MIDEIVDDKKSKRTKRLLTIVKELRIGDFIRVKERNYSDWKIFVITEKYLKEGKLDFRARSDEGSEIKIQEYLLEDYNGIYDFHLYFMVKNYKKFKDVSELKDLKIYMNCKPHNGDISISINDEILGDSKYNSIKEFGSGERYPSSSEEYRIFFQRVMDTLETTHFEKILRRFKLEEFGRNISPSTAILPSEDFEFSEKIEGGIAEKYSQITGILTKLTTEITRNSSLSELGDLSNSFIEVRDKLSKLINHKEDGNIGSSIMFKIKSIFPSSEKVIDGVSRSLLNSNDIQSNIDYLFGIVNSKYERLIEIGTTLQKSKAQLKVQLELLIELSEESSEYIESFIDETEVPMHDLALNTRIKATVGKYRDRMMKIDGSITATQNTIITLGRDLPEMKTDLEDEMALGVLLSNLDDYQSMSSDIAKLVSTVTDTTSEKIHESVENLLDMQLNDTYALDYLKSSSIRASKFGSMLATKTTKLQKKILDDSKEITMVLSENILTCPPKEE